MENFLNTAQFTTSEITTIILIAKEVKRLVACKSELEVVIDKHETM